MDDAEVSFRNAGRAMGSCITRVKPVFQYLFYLAMIGYELYDCVSDGINVYLYSESDSLDVSSRNESVFRAFFFSLIVSVLGALASSIGYVLMIIGFSNFLKEHQREKNNTFKLGRLIVFFSVFCQVCFEESIQSIVLYYYIVRCSVLFSFWKISLFVCVSLGLLYAGYMFLKGAFVWFKKQNTLPRKYPACFAPCYNSHPSLIGFIALCIFGMCLALGLFCLNIATLADIIKHSEVDVPHLVAVNEYSPSLAVKISPVKDVVKSKGNFVKKLPCVMPNEGAKPSHFLDEMGSFNCSFVKFTLLLREKPKKLQYNVHYCYDNNYNCKQMKETNITLKMTNQLCSKDSPFFFFTAEPSASKRTTPSVVP